MDMKTNLAIAAILGLVLAGCAKNNIAAERPIPVSVQAVEIYGGQDVKRFSAVIQPYEQVDLSFRVGGYVQSIAQTRSIDGHSRAVQDGDKISRGTVLARLASSDYDARVQQAKAAVVEAETMVAKADLDRTRATKLFQSQSLTKPEYDNATANYDATSARLQSARAKLAEATVSSGDTVLRAPFAGTILRRNISTGSLAAPGQPAFVIADTSSVKAVFGVPDRLIPGMKLGNTLSLRTEALADRVLLGRITRVSASADPKSRVFEIEVSIPNHDELLKTGMVAALVIEDKSPEIGSAVVPIHAIVGSARQPGGYAVFYAAQESGGLVARLTDVQLGRTLGNLVVVKSGLKPGDQVITTGAGLLRDGDRVEVLMSKANPTEQR
jgi:multidrug efflux system membrane fusion protein